MGAERCFPWYAANHEGATSDSCAWEATELGQKCAANRFPPTLVNSGILTPFRDKTNKDNNEYDLRQTHYRSNIACTCGILKAGIGIFWGELASGRMCASAARHMAVSAHDAQLESSASAARPRSAEAAMGHRLSASLPVPAQCVLLAPRLLSLC